MSGWLQLRCCSHGPQAVICFEERFELCLVRLTLSTILDTVQTRETSLSLKTVDHYAKPQVFAG